MPSIWSGFDPLQDKSPCGRVSHSTASSWPAASVCSLISASAFVGGPPLPRCLNEALLGERCQFVGCCWLKVVHLAQVARSDWPVPVRSCRRPILLLRNCDPRPSGSAHPKFGRGDPEPLTQFRDSRVDLGERRLVVDEGSGE